MTDMGVFVSGLAIGVSVTTLLLGQPRGKNVPSRRDRGNVQAPPFVPGYPPPPPPSR